VTQHELVWKAYLEFAKEPEFQTETGKRVFKRAIQFDESFREDLVEWLVQRDRVAEAVQEYMEALDDERFVSSRGKTRYEMQLELCQLIVNQPVKNGEQVIR